MSNSRKVGRNEPCPCGSGEKFKGCCLGKPSPPFRAPSRFETLIRDSAEPPPTSVKAPEFSRYIWDLVKRDEKLRAGLVQVERNADNFVKQYCVPSSLPTPELQRTLNAETIQQLLTELAALQMTYGRRLATIYCDSVDSLARRRLNLASLALRAYLELTGAHLYFEQRLTKRLVDGICTPEQMDDVNELLRVGVLGGRFEWGRFLQGGTPMRQLIDEYAKAKDHEHEPSRDIRQKSPGAFVSEVEKHFAKQWPAHKGKVRTIYAMLSDICHPSLGGDLFFAEIPQRPGWIEHRAEPHDEMLREFIRRIALPVLLDISRITVWTLKRIGQVAESLNERHTKGEVPRIPPVKDDLF